MPCRSGAGLAVKDLLAVKLGKVIASHGGSPYLGSYSILLAYRIRLTNRYKDSLSVLDITKDGDETGRAHRRS